VLPTLNVRPWVVAFTLVNADFTLAGTPETDRLTGFSRPDAFISLILTGRFQPSWPTNSVTDFAEAARLKLGDGIINSTVAEFFVIPEVPVMVNG
jgi:hypothetical protein